MRREKTDEEKREIETEREDDIRSLMMMTRMMMKVTRMIMMMRKLKGYEIIKRSISCRRVGGAKNSGPRLGKPYVRVLAGGRSR